MSEPHQVRPDDTRTWLDLYRENARLEERLREVTAEWESCLERDRAHRQEMQDLQATIVRLRVGLASILDRVRPGSEAAPWVVEELRALGARDAELD